MSVQHQYRQLDEAHIDDIDTNASTVSEIYHIRVQPDEPVGASIKWIRIVGLVQIINGFITGLLGALEVFIIPMLEDKGDSHAIVIGKRNCYAAGIFAGIMMIVTGSTAVRSSISQRGSTIQRYMILLIVSILLYAIFATVVVAGYYLKWTLKENFPEGSSMYEVHMFVTASTLLGLMFILTAFFQYLQPVCFGDIQLCKQCLVGCFPCIFKDRNDIEEETSCNIIV